MSPHEVEAKSFAEFAHLVSDFMEPGELHNVFEFCSSSHELLLCQNI
jgi:hypothetical protein